MGLAVTAAFLLWAVHGVDLRDVLAFSDAPPDGQTQWRLFHHFGAALRDAS